MQLKKAIALFLVLTLLSSPFMALASLADNPAPVATPATTAPEDSEAYATSAGTNPDEPEPEEIDPVEPDPEVLEAEPPEELGEETPAPPKRALATNKTLSAVTIGDTVKINVNGTATEFIVVQHGKPSGIYDDSFNNGTWLLMKDIYEEQPWNTINGRNSYADSSIHSYLQYTFFNLIDAKIQNQIKQVKVPYRPGDGVTLNVNSGANGLTCRIFLLAGYEMNWTRGNMPADGATISYFAGTTEADLKRIAYFSGTATQWYLRSPSAMADTRVWGVNINGGPTEGSGGHTNHGIRPVFVLPNTLRVNSSGFVETNSLPTTPTGITASGSVNSWDTDTVTWNWNASTDANGDTITYPVEISVNGGAWTQVQNATARSYTRTINIPGDTYLQARVRAYDGKEYSSAYLTSGIVSINHDTTNPTIQAVAVPNNDSYAKDKVKITVIVSDVGSGLGALTVPDGVTPSGNQTLSGATATLEFETSVNGSYTFVVTDKANNSASATVSPSKIDADNPEISYTTNPPAGEFTNGDVEINLTFSDATSGLDSYSSLNGTEALSGNIDTRSFTAGSNGNYPFSVTDLVGHSTAINVLVNMIDRIKPTTAITPRVQSWSNAASVMLDVEAADDYSGIDKIIMPDGSEHPGSSTAYEITENGDYSAYSLDRASNVSNTAAVNYQWFDRTRPTVRSVAFVPTTSSIVKWFSDLLGFNQHVRIEATGDDTPEGNEGESGIVTMHYRVLDGDGGVVQDWTQVPYGTTPSIDYDISGIVEIYFKDAGGNASDTESYDILVDLTPPTVTYTLSTEEDTHDPVTVTLTLTDEPNGSGAKGFLLPDGNIFAAQAQITYTFDENGIKYFTGYDRAGNPKEIAVEVSNIVPQPLEGDWESNQVVIDAVLHATGKRTISDVTKADMLKIIFLDLSANSLTSLPGILANAENLERLDLRSNEFTSIPDCVFEFSRLRWLDVSNNNITNISERIRDLKHLDTFDVRLNYLIDYSLPMIIPHYYDNGNFTLNGAGGQYSFRILPHDGATEYIGNTAQLSVEWSYSGAPIGGGLEEHRKELYSSFYPLYRTYRPMLYKYLTANGTVRTGTPDYVQVHLLDTQTMSAKLRLGSESGTNIQRMSTFASPAVNLLEATSQGVEVRGLPEPEIVSIDASTNTVFIQQPDFELSDRTDLRAIVVVTDTENVHLQTKEVKVSDKGNIRIALNTALQKDYRITAKFTNHGVDSNGASVVNASVPPSTSKPGASGSGKTRVETQYIVKELTPDAVAVEKIVEKFTPPVYIQGDSILINGMPELEPETSDLRDTLIDEPTPKVKAEPIALNPIVPDVSTRLSGDGMSNTTISVLFVSMLILCALMLPLLIILAWVNRAHAGGGDD